MDKVVLVLALDLVVKLRLLKDSLVRILLCLHLWRSRCGLNHRICMGHTVDASVILFLGNLLSIDTSNSQWTG